MINQVALHCFFLLCIASVVFPYTLPYFEAPPGTHYETGLAIGKHFSSRIIEFAQGYDALHTRLKPFAKSKEGSIIVANFILDNTNKYAHYVDELTGIAHGANVPVEDIWLLHLRSEINGILNRNETMVMPEELNCMDIILNDGNTRSIAHNEDSASRIKSYAYLLKLNIIGQPSITAYTYPGMIPGNAFGFNSYGTIITTNSESPIDVKNRGIARAFLNRDFYSAKSSSDIISMVTQAKNQTAAGFAVNFGNINETMLYNLETAPNQLSTRIVCKLNPRLAHFNLYQRISVREHQDPSSVHRKNRYDQFPAVQTQKDVLKILGDTQDNDYPIYRNAKSPDTGVITSATVYFDLKIGTMTIYIENPKESEPVLIMKI
jgi:hypothetical protein